MQEIIQKYFGIKPEQAATILITLFVFVSGFVFNWVGKAISKFGTRHSHRRLFLDLVRRLNISVSKHRSALRASKNKLRLEDPEWINYKSEFHPISVFKEIGYKDSFIAFFKGAENCFRSESDAKREEAFNTVWENLTRLEFLKDSMFETFNVVNNDFNTNLDKWHVSLQNLRKHLEEAAVQIRNSLNNSNSRIQEMTAEINNIYAAFAERSDKERSNVYIADTYFVTPIHKVVEKYRGHLELRIYFDLVNETRGHYRNMSNLLVNLVDQMEVNMVQLEKIEEKNENAMRVLSTKI